MATSVVPISSLSLAARKDQKMFENRGFGLSRIMTTKKGVPSLERKSFCCVSMTTTVNVSRFEGVTMAPPDPILGVSEAFRADTNELKLNLGVGAYRTEELQPYVLNVVKKAERLMVEKGENKEYLPIEGLAAFNKVTAELLFGAYNPIIKEGRVATVQGLSGTGSLRLAAAFIQRYFPGATALISSPTWGNHKNIFNDAGVPWSEYRYYDPRTVGLDFDGMISDIKAAPDGSFIVLHGCAHNPTGIDPTREQWEEIADVIKEKNHIPFFDVAYQGFASGSLDEDAFSVRLFVSRGLEVLVAQSYSKNLGLYAERIGAINVVCSSSDTATRVKSQLKRLARPMYSNPPVHGARIVANVVGDPTLFSEWKEEMAMMAGRIHNVRQALYNSLTEKDKTGKDWSFILKQIGMFSFTGLNKSQENRKYGNIQYISGFVAAMWRKIDGINAKVQKITCNKLVCLALSSDHWSQLVHAHVGDLGGCQCQQLITLEAYDNENIHEKVTHHRLWSVGSAAYCSLMQQQITKDLRWK